MATNEIRDFDAAIIYNLLAAMDRHKWSTRASRDGGMVEEVMQLISFGDAGATSAITADLEELGRLAQAYKFDQLRDNGVWWRWAGENETIKRVLLDKLWLEYPANKAVSPHGMTKAMIAELHFNRHALFEGEVSRSTVGSSNLNGFGGKVTIPTGGSADGRIHTTTIRNGATIGSTLNGFTLGIRPVYEGHANFDPDWPLAVNMTAGTDMSVNQTPALGALAGARAVCDFGTNEGWAARGTNLLGDFVTNTTHMVDYIGRYRVYLRCRLSSVVSNVYLQMRSGFRLGTNQVSGPIRQIISSGWGVYDMGPLVLPPGGGRGNLDITIGSLHSFDDIELEWWAERTLGSDSLEIDSVCLMPDYAMLTGKDLNMTLDQDLFTHLVHPDGKTTSWRLDDNGRLDTGVDIHAANWVMPKEGGVLVWLQAGDGQEHPEFSGANITLQDYKRYPSLNKD